MNKRTRTIQATSNTSTLNSDTDIPHWIKASSSEEEYIGENKCRRIIQVNIIDKEVKGRGSEEEEIGIRKCSRRSRVNIINEEVKGWTSSSK